MKRILILALLPVFLYSIIGWQWIFALRLYAHQVNEWTAFFDEEDLEIITIKNDAQHHDTFFVNGHELYHKGKLFDIKYKKRRADEVVYYCHSDNEEHEMYTSLNQQIKDDLGTSACGKQKLVKVVKVSDFANQSQDILFDQKEFCEIIFLYSGPLRLNLRGTSVFVPPDADSLLS